MPFQVSITDGDGNPAVNGQAQIVTLVDYSNYDTAAEVGHTQAHFSDYKKIILTTVYGSYEYIASTVAGEDKLLTAPSLSTLPITDTLIYEVDDVHNVVLITVPTWDNTVAYLLASEHHVYYNGALYQCIQNGTNKNPATETAYWTEVTDDDLPTKYRLSHTWSINYDMVVQYCTEVQLGNDETKPLFQYDILKNIHLQAALKLWIMLESIDIEADREAWDRVDDVITRAKTLINEL